MRRLTLLVAAILLMAPVAGAAAADPQRWTPTGTSSLPLDYWQGVTVDPQGNLYFDGVFSGLYRTDPALRETGRRDDAIPASVRMGEGYNHIGDLSWDASEGGRLLLPLECYYPGEPNGGNTCRTGSIGVADPQSLQWRYYVKLDPTEIRKAMWNEVSPDGELVWTSSRRRPARLPQRATSCRRTRAPAGAPIHSVAAPGRRRPAERHHRRHVRRRAAVRRRRRAAARSGSGRSTSRRARGCSRPSARSRASRRASRRRA